VGEFEFSRFATGSGSGKSALFVSEQFLFDEIFGYGTAADAHKRIEFARAGVMDRLCEKLFSGAAFAGNEHRELIGRRSESFGFQDVYRPAAADDTVDGVACRP
jgi:hypothetical protein